MNPTEIIAALSLVPHPEGGHYRETWRHENGEERGSGTAIYYLLQAGERSHWHRVDAAEVWHFYAGSPLELLTLVGCTVSPAFEFGRFELAAEGWSPE